MEEINVENPTPETNLFREPNKPKKNSNLKTYLMCALISGTVGFSSAFVALNYLPSNQTIVYQSANNVIQTSTETGNNVIQVADLVQNSVVEIITETTTTSFWNQEYTSQGAGSGVVYSTNGYIITNNHVIEGAQTIKVKMHDGTSYDATLIATDSKTDIALLKIEKNDCIPAILGNSSNLVVGQEVIAVGNPLGQLGGTVTNGILSALDREITLDGRTRNLLQTNAAINPGNSGGGLFNSQGELIGLVVAKSSGTNIEGLGFAIPVDDVKEVVEQLLEYGYVTGRPSLGIKVANITNAFSAQQYGVNQFGVYVSEVIENSAAQRAGLQAGDCFVSMDDIAIDSYDTLVGIIESHKVGDTVNVQVRRDNKIIDLEVTFQEIKN